MFRLSWVPLEFSQIVLNSPWIVLNCPKFLSWPKLSQNCLKFHSSCLELSWDPLELSQMVWSSSQSCLELSPVPFKLSWVSLERSRNVFCCLKFYSIPLELSQSVTSCLELSWVPVKLSCIVLYSSGVVSNCLKFLSCCLELSWVCLKLFELSWVPLNFLKLPHVHLQLSLIFSSFPSYLKIVLDALELFQIASIFSQVVSNCPFNVSQIVLSSSQVVSNCL